jgi:hypothetical protein
MHNYLDGRILGDVRHKSHLPELHVRRYLQNITHQQVREIAGISQTNLCINGEHDGSFYWI